MSKIDESLGGLPKLLSPIGVGMRTIQFHGEEQAGGELFNGIDFAHAASP
jgi:hypothetical protein